MNVHYIILASKSFNDNYPNIMASLACGIDSDPRDDYYFASTQIKECLMHHHIAKGSITFDMDFYNTTAHGRGPFLITAIFDCKSEPFYVIPEPWSYVEDMIERCTSIDLNHTAIGYDKFFDEFEKNLKDMSVDELNKFIPEVLNVQTRVAEFYGHLMLADKTGYLLPERYQNNLYWRLPMSIKWEDKV